MCILDSFSLASECWPEVLSGNKVNWCKIFCLCFRTHPLAENTVYEYYKNFIEGTFTTNVLLQKYRQKILQMKHVVRQYKHKLYNEIFTSY